MIMEKRDIIVIGSSAGGVTALKELTSSLAGDLEATIFIAQHLAPDIPSLLPRILSHPGKMKAVHPQDGEEIRKGMIYVAPEDHHLIIENEHILVKRGPKENGFRPSVDALMRSAAYWYGSRVLGVVLTGYLNDGTSGLWSIKQFGGTTIIQNPEDALYPDMPLNVLEHVQVDHVLSLSEIAPLIMELVKTSPPPTPEMEVLTRRRIKTELEIAAQQNAFEKGIIHMGKTSNLTCPECGGSLTEIQEASHTRFRCHTGHSFSTSSLMSEISESVETRLWQSLRSMEEGIILLEQMASQAEHSVITADAEALFARASGLRANAKALLDFIYNKGQISQSGSLS
jgi:two-component system chemotaxis response regulator CheB